MRIGHLGWDVPSFSRVSSNLSKPRLDLKELGINFWLASGRMMPLGAPVCRSSQNTPSGTKSSVPTALKTGSLKSPAVLDFESQSRRLK